MTKADFFFHKPFELTVQCKGQFISKYPFGVIVLTKIPMNVFKDFCTSLKKEVKSKKVLYQIFFE